MAKYTQIAIRNTFMELLNTKTLDKISVKDIVEACEINRNTFYYYYSDIFELLEDIFHIETDKILNDINNDTTFTEEFKNAAGIIFKYRKAVIHIYNSKSCDVLKEYLKVVTKNFVRRFVTRESNNKKYILGDEDIEYIVDFYSYAIVGITLRWIKEGLPEDREWLLYKISDTFYATIDGMLEECNSNRIRHN